MNRRRHRRYDFQNIKRRFWVNPIFTWRNISGFFVNLIEEMRKDDREMYFRWKRIVWFLIIEPYVFQQNVFMWIYRVNKNALIICLILQVLSYITRCIRPLGWIASTGYTKKNTNFGQPICVKERLAVTLRQLH